MRQRTAVVLVVALALIAAACASSHPDTYTNVAAGTAAGKTLTGKVVSFTDSSVTVETTTGREVVQLNGETDGRDNLVVGANVAIAYERSSGRGEPVATRISPAATAQPEPHR
ncbi:MAG TPA: hypothetical protein VN923_00980 [Thermoanaerobaculia bacterium]|nr:hypothetical protein [Thermoanaerobaculia bacterium]